MRMLFVLNVLLPVLSADLNAIFQSTGSCLILFPYLSPNELFNLYKLNSTAKAQIMKNLKSQNFDSIKLYIGDKMHLFADKEFNFVVPNFESNSINIFSFYPKFKVYCIGGGGDYEKIISLYDRGGFILVDRFILVDYLNSKRIPELKLFYRYKCGHLAYIFVNDYFSVVLNGKVCKKFCVSHVGKMNVAKHYEDCILLNFDIRTMMTAFYVSCEMRNEKFYIYNFFPDAFEQMRKFIEKEGKNTSNFFKLITEFPKKVTIFDLKDWR